MFELMKIVGVSAVLSAGLVTASEMQPQPAAELTGGKIYTDRVPEGEPTRLWKAVYTTDHRAEEQGTATARAGKGDLLGKASQGACAAQAWPHIAPECLAGAEGGSPRDVRMITVEQRQGANTSVLMRVPASGLVRH
jgi:hypothetical protein